MFLTPGPLKKEDFWNHKCSVDISMRNTGIEPINTNLTVAIAQNLKHLLIFAS